MDKEHKSGYVNIVGNPNVGKSTLMNALIDDRLSIISSKPQTTRHRILGIWSDDDVQIIFSDSPGIIEVPRYALQQKMNSYAFSSFEDADVLLFVTDIYEKYTGDEKVVKIMKETNIPKFLVINKIDAVTDEAQLERIVESWDDKVTFDKIIPISALHKSNIDQIIRMIREVLPVGPEYYPKDQLTDKPERFFVSEIIRESILTQYKQEIPYSCEVVVESFKEGDSRGGPIINISAIIYVDRKTQKAIIIGKAGDAIKKLGTTSRLKLEEFFGQKIFLELHVSVKENWRDTDNILKGFGYET
jgi:GTP-binding protein Era